MPIKRWVWVMLVMMSGTGYAAYLDISAFIGRQVYRPSDPVASYWIHSFGVQSVSGPYMVGFLSKDPDRATSALYSNHPSAIRDPLSQNASRYRRAWAPNGSSLRYALYQSHDTPIPLTDVASSVERASLIMGQDASFETRHLVYVSALPGQWVPPGVYQELVTIELLSGFFDTRAMATRVFERPWSVVIPVGAVTYSRAVTPTELSFNPIKHTVFEGRVHYKIGANVPVTVTFASQNGYRLVDDQSEVRVSYQMTPLVTSQDVTLFFKLGMNPSKQDIQGRATDTMTVTLIEQ